MKTTYNFKYFWRDFVGAKLKTPRGQVQITQGNNQVTLSSEEVEQLKERLDDYLEKQVYDEETEQW